MNENNNYYVQRDLKNLDKIDFLISQLPPFCEDYFRSIELKTSVETRLKYAYDLRIFFSFLCKQKFTRKEMKDLTLEDMDIITDTDIEIFISNLTHYKFNGKLLQCKEKAKSRKLSSVRALFKYLFKKDYITTNNTTKIETPKLHEQEIIRLDKNEVSNLLNTAEKGYGLTKHEEGYHTRTKIRDIAILTLFLGTGIRISELVGLDNQSINFSDNSFVVQRKGGNRAILYFSEEVQNALFTYIEQKKHDPKVPAQENALFLSLQYKRMNVRSIENLVKKYAKIVSPLKKITPHKLRSTYGTQLYNETGDIYLVADVLGHKDINTTRKHYAAITQDNRKKVANIVKLKEEDDEK